MMEAASTSETSVNFYQTTRRNNPEDSHLHTRRRENIKSHLTTWLYRGIGYNADMTMSHRRLCYINGVTTRVLKLSRRHSPHNEGLMYLTCHSPGNVAKLTTDDLRMLTVIGSIIRTARFSDVTRVK
jgi:hypothetical protein